MVLRHGVILFEYEAWSVTPWKKILKDLSFCPSGVMIPGDVRRWFAALLGELAEDRYQFRDGVHNVVTRVEMCHETGSVLLNLHRRGNPRLSYSVTELRTKC